MDDYSIAICLGDISGKGMPAALLMSNLQATVRGQAFLNTSAETCLERSNVLLFRSTDKRTFVSLFYGILDFQKHTLSYANAGHNEPILFSSEEKPVILRTRGLVLGIRENETYIKDEVPINHGDILVIYSDGISEAMNDLMEEFGDEKLKSIVENNSDISAVRLIERITKAAKKHIGNAQQNDDMTLIVVKRKKS